MKLNMILTMIFCLFWISAADARVEWGPKATLGNGWVRTFAEFTLDESLGGIGIAFSNKALSGLPEMDSRIILELPHCEGLAPFDHVSLNWNPHGHEPPEIYGVPHFDFHFYLLPEEAQDRITCRDEDRPICLKAPPAELIPPNYVPTPEGVPLMGWHWVDSTSPEFHGIPFTKTFIYGYYDGQLAFIEPMITQAYLLGNAKSTTPVPVPAHFEKPGSYPTAYTVEYNYLTKIHRIVLRNFQQH